MLFPEKFKVKPKYVPVDYGYVHSELKKIGVTMLLLWKEYNSISFCRYSSL